MSGSRTRVRRVTSETWMVASDRGPTGARIAKARTAWRWLAAATIAIGALMLSGTVAAGAIYLRAGIGLDRPPETAFTDRNCSSTAPPALYGCGRGGDGAPYRSRGDFGAVPVLDVGLGYIAGPAARLEVLVEYRPRFSFEGHANFLEPARRQSVAADLSAVSGMVAGYVDLPGLGLPKIGPFGPFIGAGVGIVRTRIGETRMTFPRTTTIVPGASRVGLAWMLTAGVAVALGERATLDLAWRYSDLGEVRTGRGEGRVVWREGSREPLPLDLAATRANVASHGLLLSVRYAF